MNHLLVRITRGLWAMHPERAQAYFPLVTRLMTGENGPDIANAEEQKERALKNFRYVGENGDSRSLFAADVRGEGIPKNSVLVLNMHEPVLKRGDICAYGVDDYISMMERHRNNKDMVGVVLDTDSPGGEGHGMLAFTDYLKTYEKPVVSVIHHGGSYSAAYGINAVSDEILVQSERDEVGSIGTYVTLADIKGYWESKGLKMHEVFATESTEKNRPFLEALKGNYGPLRTQYIDPFNNTFLQLVQEHRPGLRTKGTDVLKGATYFADDAIELGLIDGYGTLETAIDRVRQLSKPGAQRTKRTTTTTMGLFGKKNTSAIEALKGVKAEELTPELLNAASAELATMGVNAFLVPVSEKAKTASELDAAMDALELRATGAEGKVKNAEEAAATAQQNEETAKAAATTAQEALAKLKGERVLGSDKLSSDKGTGGDATTSATEEKAAHAAVNDPEAPWNKTANALGFAEPAQA
jgi:ClpP class serine protease